MTSVKAEKTICCWWVNSWDDGLSAEREATIQSRMLVYLVRSWQGWMSLWALGMERSVRVMSWSCSYGNLRKGIDCSIIIIPIENIQWPAIETFWLNEHKKEKIKKNGERKIAVSLVGRNSKVRNILRGIRYLKFFWYNFYGSFKKTINRRLRLSHHLPCSLSIHSSFVNRSPSSPSNLFLHHQFDPHHLCQYLLLWTIPYLFGWLYPHLAVQLLQLTDVLDVLAERVLVSSNLVHPSSWVCSMEIQSLLRLRLRAMQFSWLYSWGHFF